MRFEAVADTAINTPKLLDPELDDAPAVPVIGKLYATHPKGDGREALVALFLQPPDTDRSEVVDLVVAILSGHELPHAPEDLVARATEVFTETMRRASGRPCFRPNDATKLAITAVVSRMLEELSP